MPDRTLFLHAGGSKTGSSALQVFLYVLAERLQELGFFYCKLGLPVKHDFTVTAGNGVNLYSALSDRWTDEAVWRSNIRNALLSLFAELQHGAICSSETLSLLSGQQWLTLREIAAEERITLIVCFYVRNLADFLSSSYDQALRHGYSFTWPQFLEATKEWEHYNALRRLEQTFDKQTLRVMSYDQLKNRIVESFLEVLGVSENFDANVVGRCNQRIVNRSMTTAEREILCALNGSSAGRLSSILSDALVSANRQAKPEPNDVGEASMQRLEEIFGSQVQWINDNFFSSENVVRLAGSGNHSEVESERSKEDELTAYKAAFKALVLEVGNSRAAAKEDIIARLLAIDWENASDPAIPPEFDPFGYLLLNGDLLIADVRPFRHYIDYGVRESRNWKLTNGRR